MLIALGMVGYLAAVTQSPITSFVIVMEMINGHALVISLMATALISSRVSRVFAPPLYESLAARYMAPLPQPAPVSVPEVPEVGTPEVEVTEVKAPEGEAPEANSPEVVAPEGEAPEALAPGSSNAEVDEDPRTEGKGNAAPRQ
jgi:hypothetical protein